MKPRMEFLQELECTLPIGEDRCIRIRGDANEVKIEEMMEV